MASHKLAELDGIIHLATDTRATSSGGTAPFPAGHTEINQLVSPKVVVSELRPFQVALLDIPAV